MKARLIAMVASASVAVAALFYLSAPRERAPASSRPFRVVSTDRVKHTTGARVELRGVTWDDVEAYLALPASAVGTRSGRLGGLVVSDELPRAVARRMAIALAAEGQIAVLALIEAEATPRALTVLAEQPEVGGDALALAGADAVARLAHEDRRVIVLTTWRRPGAKPEPGRAEATRVVDTLLLGSPTAGTRTAFDAVARRPGEHRLLVTSEPRRATSTIAWWTYRRLFLRETPAFAMPVVVSATVAPGRVEVTVEAPRARRVEVGGVVLAGGDGRFAGTAAVVGAYHVDAVYDVGGREVRLSSVPVPP